MGIIKKCFNNQTISYGNTFYRSSMYLIEKKTFILTIQFTNSHIDKHKHIL